MNQRAQYGDCLEIGDAASLEEAIDLLADQAKRTLALVILDGDTTGHKLRFPVTFCWKCVEELAVVQYEGYKH